MDSNHDTRAKRFGWRLVARVGVVLGLLIGGGILSTGAASAAPPLPEGGAKVDCNGRVTFSSVAWLPPGWKPGDDPKPRTNGRVEILYSFDARKFIVVPGKPTWQYNTANNFQFKDTFDLPQPLPKSVMVAFKTPEPWADGGRPGTHTETEFLKIPACPEQQQTAPVVPPPPTADASPADAGIVTAAPVIPAEPQVAPVAAPAAAAGGSQTAIVIVASLIAVALVIDAIGITLFVRRRRARMVAAA
jgi:hypothetical protein